MRLNAFFPTRDIGTDPAKIRDWAQAAEDLGYAGIEVADHVFGTTGRDGWTPLYNETDAFHETFVTLGFRAPVTGTIKLSTGVLILPQRQTGLVAKQAAEVDILCGGRLRLGIGVGWNFVEYQALGEDWATRGVRQAEQVEVLRALWTQDRHLQRPLPRPQGGQHHPGADPASDPDLARRHVGRGGEACGSPRRRLDADPAAGRSGTEARSAARASRDLQTRPRRVRARRLAAHARGRPATLGGRRRRLAGARRRPGHALSDVPNPDLPSRSRRCALREVAVEAPRRRPLT
jgi:alkanesulfonate monooxygenase SsuD/methylene tetrahydromethanopterin reductase-like flavin-dependent oxidoreductase (luciferase family)